MACMACMDPDVCYLKKALNLLTRGPNSTQNDSSQKVSSRYLFTSGDWQSTAVVNNQRSNSHIVPADTCRNNNVIITPKRRRNVVVTQ